METYRAPLTPDLARAGRALTQVSVDAVAQAASLEIQQVRDFEHRGLALQPEANDKLRAALEEFGVVFFAEDSDGGYGVRRKYSDAKVRQLQRWEGEGGPAYEDDI